VSGSEIPAGPEKLFEALFARKRELEACRRDIWSAYELLRDCFADGGKLLLCGNGGSCADCDHIAGELMKGFMRPRPLPGNVKRALRELGSDGATMADKLQGALKAINLCGHQALNTAIANDISPSLIFAQQTLALGVAGDVLMGLSTSGNAENVCGALIAARAAGMARIGMTGEGGGRMAPLCDVAIRAPASQTYEIQEYHLPIYHTLCAMLEAHFF